MSASVVVDPLLSARPALRVRIASDAEDWVHGWRLRLSARGHHVVDADADCDVILADGAAPRDHGAPTLVIGNAVRASATAMGVLDPAATDEQVDAALHAVAAGLVVQSLTVERGFGAAHEPALTTVLSPREAEVLSAIANGDSNKMIARRLAISLHTVKFHVESVFRKLGARSRAEAVARAVEYRRRETIEL